MKIREISIIIPTLNHREEINDLSHNLSERLWLEGVNHEITCFDKGSTDGTVSYLHSISQKIPIKVVEMGPGHKITESITDHLANDHTEYIALINPGCALADKVCLQLLNHLDGHDLIYPFAGVTSEASLADPVAMVIKRSVLSQLMAIGNYDEKHLHWSLIQYANHLGYKVDDQAICEITPVNRLPWWRAIRLKVNLAFSDFPPLHLLPEDKDTMKWSGVLYSKIHFITHTTIHHRHSAIVTLTNPQKFILFILGGILLASLVLNWHLTLLVLFSSIVVLYFLDLLFNVLIIFRSLLTKPEIVITNDEVKSLPEETLPVVTILCPLYKEESILPQFIEAMSSLDYPKDKLQVLLLLEENDSGTIEVAKRLTPPFIDILIVPNSLPRTKPKALNWGLGHASGEYLVIYDAEDIPE